MHVCVEEYYTHYTWCNLQHCQNLLVNNTHVQHNKDRQKDVDLCSCNCTINFGTGI